MAAAVGRSDHIPAVDAKIAAKMKRTVPQILRGTVLSFSLGVGPSVVRETQYVIHADAVKLRQSAEHSGRYHSSAAFVVGIGALGQVYFAPHGLLGQVMVLPEISYSFIFYHKNITHEKYRVNDLFFGNFEHIVLRVRFGFADTVI